MLAEFSIIPLEGGPHFSEQIAFIIKIVRESKLPYNLTSMGTIVEGDWNKIMALIKKCHKECLKKNQRVYTTIKIDDYKGRTGRMEGKVKSVKEKLKKM